MGEYANYKGEQIKIGTCESMYYLRADQRHLVSGGDVTDSDYWNEVRFRFPFPDEDHIEPGRFEDHDRGVKIPGWTLPADFKGHYSVQFVSNKGYNLCVPCPEGHEHIEGLKIHRNGWNGGPVVSQQRIIDGNRVTVVACGACGAAWRLPTLKDAEPIIVAFRSEADRQEWRRGYDSERDEYTNDYGHEPAHTESHRAFLHAMADRIAAGYLMTPVAA